MNLSVNFSKALRKKKKKGGSKGVELKAFVGLSKKSFREEGLAGS